MEPHAEQSRSLNPVQQAIPPNQAVINGNKSANPADSKSNSPSRAVKESDKRTLRSQNGGLRSKSELSWYFPNYEELINDEPKEPDALTAETRIQIIEDSVQTPTPALLSTSPVRNAFNKLRPSRAPEKPSTSKMVQSASSDSESAIAPVDAQRVDFSAIDRSTFVGQEDPLGDNFYAKAHRRAERQEKQLRNIEKERAMHEKVQLERLLESLKGHDWLKIMGISGVTDVGKKSFEPKRDYFIREIEILLEKFREWKEEEKRRKTEREERLMAEEGEAASEDMTDVDAPNGSDVDACAARQLHQEAISATGRQAPSKTAVPRPAHPPSVQKPFTSFYSKPYLRDAALGKHRRGRIRLAFGQPLPVLKDKPFELPGDILTQDALAASARSRRRFRRESRT